MAAQTKSKQAQTKNSNLFMTDSNGSKDDSRRNSGGVCECPYQGRQILKLPPLEAHLIFWPIMVLGLAADLWTKKAVFEWLRQRDNFPIINGFVQLVLAENDGAAFGMAAGQHRLLAAVSAAAMAVILVIFFFGGSRGKLYHIALGLFAAGVGGNLWDRVFNNGRVRDFIDVVYWPGRHWPAFNFADTMLCIGVVALVISTFFTGRLPGKRAQQHK